MSGMSSFIEKKRYKKTHHRGYIPVIKADIIEYQLNRLYCGKCHRIYEPEIPDALSGTTLSIRTMLTVAYFRIGMRMSIENILSTMMNVFGIGILYG